MAAKKKKSAAKKAAKRPVANAKAKPKARSAKRAASRPAAKARAGGQGEVVYSDVLHQLRESLVARLIR